MNTEILIDPDDSDGMSKKLSWEIIHGDCLKTLRTMPDNHVECVITDPPYNVGLDYTGSDDNKTEDVYRSWCEEWFKELERVCSGTIAISVGQANLSLWAGIKKPSWWLAWWKPAAMGRCVVGFNNWEPIAVYKRGKINKLGCDVIRAPISTTDKSVEGHPCPKPVEWAAKQIEMFALPGVVVLDPFSGSGTTGVAATKMGRRFIGIECESSYCKMAKKRIGAVVPSIL